MNFDRVLQELRVSGRAQFTVGGSLYGAVVKEDATIQFTTLVFQADDRYIPQSVREVLMSATLTGQLPLQSRFSVADEDGMVLMHVVVDAFDTFTSDLTEFIFLSEEWRQLLNDQGQRDLIAVRA